MVAYYLTGPGSFQSIWYWVLTILVWTMVTHRTLGVPYDMLLRARRLPELRDQVDVLAHITAARICGVHGAVGAPLAALAGFALAAMFVFGFVMELELAKALFLLCAPLSVVAYSTLRIAMNIEGRDHRGIRLVRILARRRFWHQVIAVVSILLALGIARAGNPIGPV